MSCVYHFAYVLPFACARWINLYSHHILSIMMNIQAKNPKLSLLAMSPLPAYVSFLSVGDSPRFWVFSIYPFHLLNSSVCLAFLVQMFLKSPITFLLQRSWMFSFPPARTSLISFNVSSNPFFHCQSKVPLSTSSTALDPTPLPPLFSLEFKIGIKTALSPQRL